MQIKHEIKIDYLISHYLRTFSTCKMILFFSWYALLPLANNIIALFSQFDQTPKVTPALFPTEYPEICHIMEVKCVVSALSCLAWETIIHSAHE